MDQRDNYKCFIKVGLVMIYDKGVREFVDHINTISGNKYDVSVLVSIGVENDTTQVNDSPGKYYLSGLHDRDNSVLMVSNKKFPDFIARAVYNINQVREVVSSRSRDVILEPVVDGYFRGQSFALWAEHRPISGRKVIREFQKILMHGQVFSFLCHLAKDGAKTKLTSDEILEYVDSPLRCIESNAGQSIQIRSIAEQALTRLANEEWRPITTIQHSDFWLGNILLQKSKNRPLSNDYGFCVIDWSGALLNGAPVFDFIRYCMSSNVSITRAKKESAKYLEAIQISQDEMIFYLVIALGNIGLNLEEFPESRFFDMCNNCLSYCLKIKY